MTTIWRVFLICKALLKLRSDKCLLEICVKTERMSDRNIGYFRLPYVWCHGGLDPSTVEPINNKMF